MKLQFSQNLPHDAQTILFELLHSSQARNQAAEDIVRTSFGPIISNSRNPFPEHRLREALTYLCSELLNPETGGGQLTLENLYAIQKELVALTEERAVEDAENLRREEFLDGEG